MNDELQKLLDKLHERVVPDECIVYVCPDCRDTGYLEQPDPRGHEGSVLVRECPACAGLTPREMHERWYATQREEQRRVREWRGTHAVQRENKR